MVSLASGRPTSAHAVLSLNLDSLERIVAGSSPLTGLMYWPVNNFVSPFVIMSHVEALNAAREVMSDSSIQLLADLGSLSF